jgi:hypothetical protein
MPTLEEQIKERLKEAGDLKILQMAERILDYIGYVDRCNSNPANTSDHSYYDDDLGLAIKGRYPCREITKSGMNDTSFKILVIEDYAGKDYCKAEEVFQAHGRNEILKYIPGQWIKRLEEVYRNKVSNKFNLDLEVNKTRRQKEKEAKETEERKKWGL